MDNLLKQTRVSFSALEEERQDKQYIPREGRIPAQKTVSFKGESKKGREWFQQHFSGQMSNTDNSSDGNIETAIAAAAAAYAIAYMEEQGSLNQKRPTGSERSPTKTKSKRKESTNNLPDTSNTNEFITDSTKVSRWLSGKEANEYGRPKGEKVARKSKTLYERMLEDLNNDRVIPKVANGTTPAAKKTPTFTDNYLNDPGSNRFERPEDTGKGLPEAFRYPRTMKSRKEETKADIWEREKIAKTRKWYEKLNSKIIEWENQKKLKAKRQLERQQSELENRRARYLQEYRNEISRIDKIVSGARAASDERKKTEELKTVKKANRIRSTGKVSHTCLCF